LEKFEFSFFHMTNQRERLARFSLQVCAAGYRLIPIVFGAWVTV
jgi:hypothetical protein